MTAYRTAAPPPERSRALTAAELVRLRKDVRALWLWLLVAPIAASPLLFVVLLLVVGWPAAWLLDQIAPDLDPLATFPSLASFAIVHVVYQAALWPRLLRLRRDVREARVLEADGTVRWRAGWGVEIHGGPWMPSVDRDLWLPEGGPGQGRAYYLPHSRQVLSWEPLPSADGQEQARTRHQEALAQVFRCERDWLAENRQGALAPGQRLRLARRAAAWIFGGALLPPLFLLPFRGDSSAYVYGSIGMLVAIGCWAWASRFVRDALDGAVAVAEGAVSLRTTPRTRTTSQGYYYDVAGTSFAVSARAHRAIIPGAVHRVFHGPRSRVIVGVEMAPAREPHVMTPARSTRRRPSGGR